jgi:hypothetical protein
MYAKLDLGKPFKATLDDEHDSSITHYLKFRFSDISITD